MIYFEDDNMPWLQRLQLNKQTDETEFGLV